MSTSNMFFSGELEKIIPNTPPYEYDNKKCIVSGIVIIDKGRGM